MSDGIGGAEFAELGEQVLEVARRHHREVEARVLVAARKHALDHAAAIALAVMRFAVVLDLLGGLDGGEADP